MRKTEFTEERISRFSLASIVGTTKGYWTHRKTGVVNNEEEAGDNITVDQLCADPRAPKARTSKLSMASFNVQQNPISYKLYGDGKRLQEEQLKMDDAPAFIIHPHSNFRIFWDCVTMLVLMINYVYILYSIAFYNDGNTSFHVLFLISDIWFIFDMLINFRTGIVNENGVESVIETDPNTIRRSYIHGWFAIDLISSVPWDVIGSLFGDDLRLGKLFRILKVLKLFRVTRLAKAIHQWEDVMDFQYGIQVNEYLVKMVKLAVIIFSVIHLNACVLFAVPSLMGFPGVQENEKHPILGPSWPYLRNLTQAEPAIQYSWSVFKAASHMLVIGYGQAPPQCLYDMWVTIWSMITGCITFALMIAEITSVIQSMNSSASAYKEKVQQVKEYMDFCKVPRELRIRVRDYYDVKYQGKMFNETAILDELNPLLREKVINYNCRSLVKSVEFLATADPDFVSDLISCLNVEVYLQGDKIIEEGCIGNQMYFISQGSVAVSTKMQMRPRILSEGEHFGEICLFVSNLKRTATVVAQTNAYVYTLAADDFNSTLRWYPSEKVEMQRVAIERMEILLNSVKRITTMKRKSRNVNNIENEKDLEIDADIYLELEQQRNALIDLQKKTENQIHINSNNV